MAKISLTDCEDCYNDFYNHNRMGANEATGEPRCWSFAGAVLIAALDVPIDMAPPYTKLKPTRRPSCYRKQRFVRVKPEALTKEGYWR